MAAKEEKRQLHRSVFRPIRLRQCSTLAIQMSVPAQPTRVLIHLPNNPQALWFLIPPSAHTVYDVLLSILRLFTKSNVDASKFSIVLRNHVALNGLPAQIFRENDELTIRPCADFVPSPTLPSTNFVPQVEEIHEHTSVTPNSTVHNHLVQYSPFSTRAPCNPTRPPVGPSSVPANSVPLPPNFPPVAPYHPGPLPVHKPAETAPPAPVVEYSPSSANAPISNAYLSVSQTAKRTLSAEAKRRRNQRNRQREKRRKAFPLVYQPPQSLLAKQSVPDPSLVTAKQDAINQLNQSQHSVPPPSTLPKRTVEQSQPQPLQPDSKRPKLGSIASALRIARSKGVLNPSQAAENLQHTASQTSLGQDAQPSTRQSLLFDPPLNKTSLFRENDAPDNAQQQLSTAMVPYVENHKIETAPPNASDHPAARTTSRLKFSSTGENERFRAESEQQRNSSVVLGVQDSNHTSLPPVTRKRGRQLPQPQQSAPNFNVADVIQPDLSLEEQMGQWTAKLSESNDAQRRPLFGFEPIASQENLWPSAIAREDKRRAPQRNAQQQSPSLNAPATQDDAHQNNRMRIPAEPPSPGEIVNNRIAQSPRQNTLQSTLAQMQKPMLRSHPQISAEDQGSKGAHAIGSPKRRPMLFPPGSQKDTLTGMSKLARRISFCQKLETPSLKNLPPKPFIHTSAIPKPPGKDISISREDAPQQGPKSASLSRQPASEREQPVNEQNLKRVLGNGIEKGRKLLSTSPVSDLDSTLAVSSKALGSSQSLPGAANSVNEKSNYEARDFSSSKGQKAAPFSAASLIEERLSQFSSIAQSGKRQRTRTIPSAIRRGGCMSGPTDQKLRGAGVTRQDTLTCRTSEAETANTSGASRKLSKKGTGSKRQEKTVPIHSSTGKSDHREQETLNTAGKNRSSDENDRTSGRERPILKYSRKSNPERKHAAEERHTVQRAGPSTNEAKLVDSSDFRKHMIEILANATETLAEFSIFVGE